MIIIISYIHIDNSQKILDYIVNKSVLKYIVNTNIEDIDFIYILYNKDYSIYNLESLIKDNYHDITFKFYCENNFINIIKTINCALNDLNNLKDTPILYLDYDKLYLNNIINKWNGQNCIFSIKDKDKSKTYGSYYIKYDDTNYITDIKHNERISDFRCTGAVGFKSILQLKEYTSTIIENNIIETTQLCLYNIINEMTNDNIIFININIENKYYFSLSTSSEIDEYEHPFIFDLDGTLVDSDNIYTLVWKNIMNKYNLPIDQEFFNYFIRGNNDITYLKYIIPNITDDKIQEISNLKDELFIKYLKSYNKDIMIEGAKKFIENNKNRRMGIVTNCNRKSAEFILKITGISEYMHFLICSEDCTRHKPDKEPYNKAINILQIDRRQCTIFEDSNSGYTSAMSLGETKICLIVNNASDQTILTSNEYKITNYNDFDILKLKNNNEFNIINLIKNTLNTLPIKDIVENKDNLKTGYICDIKSFKLILNNRTQNVILKIENKDNELSSIASKLNLYNNEVIFFEKISRMINIDIPKYYCHIIIDDRKAILLENLLDYNGCFNLNLNLNIDIIISVISQISEMHNRFYFEDSSKIIPSMLNISKINDIYYYKELINTRFPIFLKNNNILLTDIDKKILVKIYQHFDLLITKAGMFPLNFCHGDFKSPNIFYKESYNKTISPVFLDWQYIHLNKGISDIVFLLAESIEFDENINNIIINYYYKKSIMYNNIKELMNDFKIALCIFPFFVMIWFNSENRDNLLDKVFPIKFMKNTLKYYNKYLDDSFFNSLQI